MIQNYDHLPRQLSSDVLHTQPFRMHLDRFLPEHCAVSNAVSQIPWLFLFFLFQLHPKVLMHGFFFSRLLQMSGVGSSVGVVDGASVGVGSSVGVVDGASVGVGSSVGVVDGASIGGLVVGMLDGDTATGGPVTIPRLQHSGPLFC
jgi:hypothetical protein